MKQPNYQVVNTYRFRNTAIQAAIDNGWNADECVFQCPNGMNGFEIRIYDDWQQWQPDLHITK